MFQIFADALLIATRMEQPRNPRIHHHDPQPDPEGDLRQRRSWMSLSGLRR